MFRFIPHRSPWNGPSDPTRHTVRSPTHPIPPPPKKKQFMRTLESFEPLLDEDVRALRTEVFKMDTFFVTDVDKTPLAVAYMGTLRKSSEEVFKDVEKRLQGIEGAFR